MRNKCIVAGCPNHDNEGAGAVIVRGDEQGFLCVPCLNMLRTGVVDTPGSTFVHEQVRATGRKENVLTSIRNVLQESA